MSYGFAATCERCGNSQFLELLQQERRIGYKGQFICDDCGGRDVPVQRERPVRKRDVERAVKRSTRPPKPRPVKPVEPVGPKCCLNNGPVPSYFRRCPDCPIPS